MHWAFNSVKATIGEHGEQELFTVASGVTPSGTIHIGNFREIMTVDLIKRAFKYMGKNVRHIHSWDDNDVFRKVPKNMPNQEMLQQNLRKCIVDVPDPYGEEESYAMKHIKDVETSVAKVGINPVYIYQSKKYRNCDYADNIKFALEHTNEIKEILNVHRKEPLADSWLPASIFCDKCQKDTITNLEYKGNYILKYKCECGHEEEFNFKEKGIAKLLWRIDWPMRWAYEKVNFEPGGKDHSTPGGSFDTGKEIVKLWGHKAPSYLMYDFIQIKGGAGKISSSSGAVVTLNDCLDIYEPEIIRYLFAGTRPNTEFAISFDTDVIKIYEDYDKCERIYYNQIQVNDKEKGKQKLIYEFSQIDENLETISKVMPIQVPVRHITTILQIKSLDIDETIEYFRKEIKNKSDESKLRRRITCVKNWIQNYADEQFKFSVNEESDLSKLNETEKKALKLLKTAVKNSETEEELSQAIFDIPKQLEMQMKDFFTLCYQIIIGKEKGPKLANFIMEIGKERILKLL